jgi:hypothetical protein
LNIICDTYQISTSEYMQEAMKFDLEEGNFCDVLLGKIIDETSSCFISTDKGRRFLHVYNKLRKTN